ncbi:type II toxin-antitoxin system Phd/YefM family antitoxin [Nautilia sp.]
MISYEEYSAMKETMYLLSSKNNRQRLLKSIEDIENMQIIKKEI